MAAQTLAEDIRFPPIDEPFDSGWLKVSELHEVYYEQCGKSNGNPVIYLHGGPGGGCTASSRRFFDPEVYRIILMDQRGSGRSKPNAELRENTTWDLVEDIERLRKHLGIDKWVVFGGSWGSTLSLTYSIKHTDRVKALILRGIFTLTREEVSWLYQEGSSYIYPDYWEDFIAPIPKIERGDMVRAYYRRLTGDDRQECLKYARCWAQYELRMSMLVSNPEKVEARISNEDWVLPFARIESHYFVNNGWYDDPEYLLNNVDKIRHIPATIINGRYDMITPMKTAWQLHQRWPEAEFLLIQKAGHSAMEPGVMAALLAATEKYKNL